MTLGNYDLLSSKKIVSFNKLVDEYFSIKKNNLSNATINRYNDYLRQFNFFFSKYFQYTLKDITLIKASYIAESIEYLTNKGTDEGRVWSATTANSYRGLLASIFKYAVKKSYIKNNPASEIPDKNVEKRIDAEFYSDEEIEKIINSSEEKWRLFYSFILKTGLRLGEMLNLKWENVVLNSNSSKIFIKSSDTWSTKTKKGRVIPLNNSAQEIMKKQKEISQKEFVFTDSNGSQIKENKPLYELKKTLKKLGINGNIHKFRHTFATKYISSGAGSLYDLKELMGHKSIETTQIYAHLAEEYLRETLVKMDG